MPQQPSITISLQDLQNVMELIQVKKYNGDHVQITVINDTIITVRDIAGLLIGTLQQTIQE